VTESNILYADNWQAFKVTPESWPWKHFSPQEMACRHCGELKLSRRAMDKLSALREYTGAPFIINSAYRCKVHNASLPGASPASQHLQGKAFDVSMANHDPVRFHTSAQQLGFGGIGTYPDPRNNFIHVDDRGSTARWGKPFARRETRFAPEPATRPKVEATKQATVVTTGVVAAHTGLKTVLAEVAPLLPTEWVSYGAVALAVVGVGVVVYKVLIKGGLD
jgi:zinc D-Ala-D-Ala carboxypeptidase